MIHINSCSTHTYIQINNKISLKKKDGYHSLSQEALVDTGYIYNETLWRQGIYTVLVKHYGQGIHSPDEAPWRQGIYTVLVKHCGQGMYTVILWLKGQAESFSCSL